MGALWIDATLILWLLIVFIITHPQFIKFIHSKYTDIQDYDAKPSVKTDTP